MPEYQLVLSPASRSDLQNIYHYGAEQWGKKKSREYLSEISEKLWDLTSQPFLGAERPEISSTVRSLPLHSHTVFYRVNKQKIEILRILHSRQDAKRNLF